MFGIILAGGSGSRLWPLSRELYPKQLLSLYTDKSLLQATYEGLNKLLPAENIISITNTKHLSNVKMQLSALNSNPVILAEPVSKNTAPAIALTAKYIIENFSADEIQNIAYEGNYVPGNDAYSTYDRDMNCSEPVYKPTDGQAAYYYCLVTNTYNGKPATISTPLFQVLPS